LNTLPPSQALTSTGRYQDNEKGQAQQADLKKTVLCIHAAGFHLSLKRHHIHQAAQPEDEDRLPNL
jgi:hypothetical protein